MATPRRAALEAAVRGRAVLAAALTGLAGGAIASVVGADSLAAWVWGATATGGLILAAAVVLSGVRQHRLGVDIVAVLALAGTLAVGEFLAGGVLTVMLASGRALESGAAARAAHDLRALLDRVPRSAHRHGGAGVRTVPLDHVVPGDLLLIAAGEVVPVDGLVEQGVAVLDESSLTGEALPVERPAGAAVRSGVVNAGGPFDLRATTTAADSTYAGIVQLVAAAEAQSAPFVRLADRYAAVFVALSLTIAAAAGVLGGGLGRAVAVLVVATPCPLILAAPVAIVAGLSRAARRGVIIKGGAALEALAAGRTLMFDKTGTLTAGTPTVHAVVTAGTLPAGEVLRLAASLDQVSPHVLAGAIVMSARERGLDLALPVGVREAPGQGVRGTVGGLDVAVGKAAWVAADANDPWVRRVRRRASLDGSVTVFVGVNGAVVGALMLEDHLRPEARQSLRALRALGIDRIVMLTGDRSEVAESVGAMLGVDDVLAERTPSEKVAAVELERRTAPTIMVGDGINDAAALALADVGIAIGARGATASSAAADIVLGVDRIDRVAEARRIARRSGRIARESVVVGVSLSVVAMVVAAFGYLPAVWGALLQEAIDVAVITNALRARGRGREEQRPTPATVALAERFRAEHATLGPDLERIRRAADALGNLPVDAVLKEVREVHTFLTQDLLPHELAEDRELYPALARMLGGNDPTGAMSREHLEISHQIHRLGRMLEGLDAGVTEDDITDLRRQLYGLLAVLRLHFAQEDEQYLCLGEERAPVPRPVDVPQ